MEELIPIFFFLSVAAVLILRPLTKKVGVLMEAMARAKLGSPAESAEVAQLKAALEHLSKRLELTEERLDFTERLVSSTQRTPRTTRLGPVPVDGLARGYDALPGDSDYLR